MVRAAVQEGPEGRAPLLFLCEHASHHIPPRFGTLGLDPALLTSHIAWDPGALALARTLSAALHAPLVAGAVSRLVYDCNRPPEAPDAIPVRSEMHDIPGNRDLSAAERQARVDAVYRPFCAAVSAAIERARPAALVTVHSFTPVFFGRPRAVEIGVLHDADTRLADALLRRLAAAAPGRDIRRNEPYGPQDGVTHSLVAHGIRHGLANVMLELRNDLLADDAGVAAMADLVAPALAAALSDCGIELRGAA